MKHQNFDRVLNEALQNPEFKEIWEADAVKREVTKAIIRERIKHKMTQEQLARRAGMKQPSLARVESGSVAPSLMTLGKIAKAFGAKLEVRFQDSP